MGTDCKSALSRLRDFFTYPSDRVIDNGIMLQKKSNALVVNGHTTHPKYNDAISDKITEIINSTKNVNKPQRALEEIEDLIKTTKETLKKDVLLGTKDVNDIVSF